MNHTAFSLRNKRSCKLKKKKILKNELKTEIQWIFSDKIIKDTYLDTLNQTHIIEERMENWDIAQPRANYAQTLHMKKYCLHLATPLPPQFNNALPIQHSSSLQGDSETWSELGWKWVALHMLTTCTLRSISCNREKRRRKFENICHKAA